jgi:hypothetical protein
MNVQHRTSNHVNPVNPVKKVCPVLHISEIYKLKNPPCPLCQRGKQSFTFKQLTIPSNRCSIFFRLMVGYALIALKYIRLN